MEQGNLKIEGYVPVVRLNRGINTDYDIRTSGRVSAANIVLNVGDLGATGDGITDDTAAIQRAIDSLDQGGEIIFSSGTYIVSDSLILSSGVSIRGDGASTIYLKDGSNCPIMTNSDHANGNTNIILSNLSFDGNSASQTEDVSVLDFTRVSRSLFENLDVQGGRRNNMFPTGTNGEGIVLRYGEYNEIRGGEYHDNNYDGIKLRGSNRNRIVGASCYNNGRSGIQISFNSPTGPPWNVGEGIQADGSNYNEISNVSVYHTTGTPHTNAPTTSGIYIHTGSFNCISNCTVYGVRQGFGLYAGATDNVFSNCTIRIRHVDRASIDIEGGGTANSRNIFTGIMNRGISGANGVHVRVDAASPLNRFIGCYGAAGSGTGTWTRTIAGSNSEFHGSFFDGSLVDTSTGSLFVEFVNDFSGSMAIPVGKIGLGLGVGVAPTAKVDLGASTTATSSLRLRSGVAPTTPNNGDIWFDGTDLKIRIDGVTKTVTVT